MTGLKLAQLNHRLSSPLAQGLLAVANGIASFACFRASKKPLYRACGGLLAIFTGYHIHKAVQRYKGERGKASDSRVTTTRDILPNL